MVELFLPQHQVEKLQGQLSGLRKFVKTMTKQHGKDIDNLWPDLSKSRSENYFEGTSISLWWPNRDENGNNLVNLIILICIIS